MIHMPHRSVTRYFVPLIDVLLLLFCIFLLMPMADEKNLEDAREAKSHAEGELESANSQLQTVSEKLSTYDILSVRLDEFEKLRKAYEELREHSRKSLQQRAYFQVIDMDPKTGAISFDPGKSVPGGRVEITFPSGKPRPDSEKIVKDIIAKHKKDAGQGREVYYYFLSRPPSDDYPTLGQLKTYRKWFGEVASSLKETQP